MQRLKSIYQIAEQKIDDLSSVPISEFKTDDVLSLLAKAKSLVECIVISKKCTVELCMHPAVQINIPDVIEEIENIDFCNGSAKMQRR